MIPLLLTLLLAAPALLVLACCRAAAHADARSAEQARQRRDEVLWEAEVTDG